MSPKKEKEDEFDKVEVVVKKTTKIIILIIGSVVAITLAGLLAWNQLSTKVQELKKPRTSVVDTDTVIIIKPMAKDTVLNVKPVTPKPMVPKPIEQPKVKTDNIIDGVNRLKRIKDQIK